MELKKLEENCVLIAQGIKAMKGHGLTDQAILILLQQVCPVQANGNRIPINILRQVVKGINELNEYVFESKDKSKKIKKTEEKEILPDKLYDADFNLSGASHIQGVKIQDQGMVIEIPEVQDLSVSKTIDFGESKANPYISEVTVPHEKVEYD